MTRTPTLDELDAMLLASDPGLRERQSADPDAWGALLRLVTPRPPFHQLRRRKRWQQACDAAVAARVRRAVVDVVLVPVWLCENDDEVPSTVWRRQLLLICGDGDVDALSADAAAGFGDAVVVGRAERAERVELVDPRWYEDDVTMVVRNEDFGALARWATERIVGVDDVHPLPPTARPTRPVPASADDAEPAVELAALEPALRARITRAIAEQRYGPDDDDDDDDDV